MRLSVKLSLLLAGATTFPLLLATSVTLPSGREALRKQLDEIYAQDARALASTVQRSLVDKLDSLTLAAGTLRFDELDAEARDQALLLVYQQTRGADVVGLFDQKADALGQVIRFATLKGNLASEHEVVSDAALTVYARNVPHQGALQTGVAVGPVYVLPDASGDPVPRIAIAIAVPGARGQRWVLAVEISLRHLREATDQFRPGAGGAAFLLDSSGRVILHPDRQHVARQVDLSSHPLVIGARDGDWIGANATVPLLGWKAVVMVPAEEGLRSLRQLQRDALLWLALGLVVAVLLGMTSVRTVTRPVEKLREAALAVTGGALETEVAVAGSDELAQLGQAFNAMTRGLREREGLKLTLTLSETLELDEVLERLLDSLGRAVRFDHGAVLIRARDGVDVVVARGARGKEEARRLMAGSSHVTQAVATLAPALSEGRQMLALPLIQRGMVIGVVSLESQRPYDEATARLAFSLAQPAAMAVENARLFDEVQRLATLDGLTGTYNRRHFMELAQLQFDSARRFNQPLSALMLDVDHFKNVNDRHGHAVGDQVLRAVAERCRAALRSIDVLGRYGGEEFAILLPGTEAANAVSVLAERIRQRVSEEPIATDAGPVDVTVSVGVAGMDPEMLDPGTLLKRADAALYEAKQAGRNRVVESPSAVA